MRGKVYFSRFVCTDSLWHSHFMSGQKNILFFLVHGGHFAHRKSYVLFLGRMRLIREPSPHLLFVKYLQVKIIHMAGWQFGAGMFWSPSECKDFPPKSPPLQLFEGEKIQILLGTFKLGRTRELDLPNIWVFTAAWETKSCTWGVIIKTMNGGCSEHSNDVPFRKCCIFLIRKVVLRRMQAESDQNFSTSPDMMVALKSGSCAIYKAGEQHSQPSCRMRARTGWRGLNGIMAPDPMSFCLTRPAPARGRLSKSSNKGKVKVLVIQLCLTLCDSMDCRLLGSSIQAILQARILEWVAISCRGSSQPRDQTWVSHIAGRLFF